MPNAYKNAQEIRVTGFYGRLYLRPRSHCNSSIRLELSVMLSRVQNQNKKSALDQSDVRKHWAWVKILMYCHPERPIKVSYAAFVHKDVK